MIKILVLSRSDLHKVAKNMPQEDFVNYHNNHIFKAEAINDLEEANFAIFQEGDGPVTIIQDRSDYPLKTLLQEVIDNMEKKQ